MNYLKQPNETDTITFGIEDCICKLDTRFAHMNRMLSDLNASRELYNKSDLSTPSKNGHDSTTLLIEKINKPLLIRENCTNRSQLDKLPQRSNLAHTICSLGHHIDIDEQVNNVNARLDEELNRTLDWVDKKLNKLSHKVEALDIRLSHHESQNYCAISPNTTFCLGNNFNQTTTETTKTTTTMMPTLNIKNKTRYSSQLTYNVPLTKQIDATTPLKANYMSLCFIIPNQN